MDIPTGGIFVEKNSQVRRALLTTRRIGWWSFRVEGDGISSRPGGGESTSWLGVGGWGGIPGGQPGELGFRGVELVLRVQKNILYIDFQEEIRKHHNHIQTVQKLFFPFLCSFGFKGGQIFGQ